MTQQDTASKMTIGAGEFSALCNLFHTVHCVTNYGVRPV
jgi:hypothetical protein